MKVVKIIYLSGRFALGAVLFAHKFLVGVISADALTVSTDLITFESGSCLD